VRRISRIIHRSSHFVSPGRRFAVLRSESVLTSHTPGARSLVFRCANAVTPRPCAHGTPLIGSVVSMKPLQPPVTISTTLRTNAGGGANQISSLVKSSRAARFLQIVTAGIGIPSRGSRTGGRSASGLLPSP
jgi:hypothetical protein